MGLRAVEMAVARGLRCLWLAHREELVDQPMRRILAEGWGADRLAVVKDGRLSGLAESPLTIASIQSLIANPELIPPADFVIFDEARHYVASTWFSRVSSRFRNAYRLGLDATPVRADGSPLGDLFERLIVGASVRELTAGGFLVPSVVLAPSEEQDELARDPIEAYQAHTPGQRALVFCSGVRYARDLASRFVDAGVPAEAIDAKSGDDARGGALRRFERGETRVIVNVRILTEGTDLPCVEAIIHASKCGALSDWIQKGGRGLRPSPETGKTKCTIVDLCGSVHRHGLLDDEHVYSLDGAGVRVAEALPPLAQCPRCYAWGRSRARCAQCGHEVPEPPPRAPKVKAAHLVEVRRADGEDKRRERLNRWALDARRAGATGASLWRIAHKYRGTYGEDAPRAWVVEAIREAERVVGEEQKRAEERRSPLFARRGGEG